MRASSCMHASCCNLLNVLACLAQTVNNPANMAWGELAGWSGMHRCLPDMQPKASDACDRRAEQ